ncbi:MAG TPA: signal peptide peptidase SppA [Geobacteraceae bacterium]|nr:signal peptide peptidase SppA [Geobacteraceae bacterium]
MRMYYLLLTSIAVVLLNGCSFNVPLLSAPKPLKEKVVEGEGRKKILILDVTGVISEREKAGGLLARGSSSMVDLTREALKKAEEDDDLAAVIVRINSPGGTVTASDIIRHDIQAFKERKKVPVYACIMSIGASGAYYIATAADQIVAHPTAITGSIGVLLLKFNVEGLLEKVGVREQTIKSGDKKDILSPFRAATPEEQRLVQVVIDQLYQRFLDVIVARPHNTLSREELKLLADGRIYTASQALAAKLIDKTGYMDDVIADLKKQIGVEKARVVIYYRPGSYKGSIYAETPGESAELASLLGISGGADFVPASGFMYLWQP